MLIKSFKAPTLKEAMANVKSEMGVDAIILHTNKIKKGGILGFHSKEIIEVIAAVEDEPVVKAPARQGSAARQPVQRTAAPAPAPRSMAPIQGVASVQVTPVAPRNVLNTYQTAGTKAGVTQAIADMDRLNASQNTPSQTFDQVLASVESRQDDQSEPMFGPMSTSFVPDSHEEKKLPQEEVTGRLIKPLDKATVAKMQQAVNQTLGNEGIAAAEAVENEPVMQDDASNEVGTVDDKDAEIQDLQNQLEEMKAALVAMSGQTDDIKHQNLQNALVKQDVRDSVIQDLISRLNGAELLASKDSLKANKAFLKYIKKTVRVANGITLYSDKPKIVALIGPTGVGKTTTLAKIAAKFVLEQGAKVALITADTYRISAVEQLKTYSDILGLPLEIVYNPDALKQAIMKHSDKQLILIDTAGRSQFNEYQMHELCGLLSIDDDIEKHLVMSATTKNSDGLELLENFSICQPERIIFTKVDETSTHGIILNMLHKKKIALSYLTNGQSVPDDIELASNERLAELLLR